ncbi:MAG: tetraacyldisaccharide 4'-kinase [Tepidisphaeraceae bacterium]
MPDQPLSPLASAVASLVEPFYAAAMRIRNGMYDQGFLAVRTLGRPAVSVGNITTGGTGKTPVSIWLADRLSRANHHPAILLRGYKRTPEGVSDEEEVLRNALAGRAAVIADPDRIRGAAVALREHPETTVFVLDDAMQHRRAARNFDLVLIHAGNFGPPRYDRILPRGLLREPLEGLKRASAFLITHVGEVGAADLSGVESAIRRHNPQAAIYHADHIVSGFLGPDGHPRDPAGTKYFAFCGLANPGSFTAGLVERLGQPAGRRIYPDHHAYDPSDLNELRLAAESAGAEFLITTEKDWAKLCRLPISLPILRAQLTLKFQDDHEERLFAAICNAIGKPD